jgi:hypothetical protein
MFLILGFDIHAPTPTSSVTLFATAGVLWLKLVRLCRLATLLPSPFLPRQLFSILKRFWVLLKSPERFKYPLLSAIFYFSTKYFSHACISFLLVFLSFCLVCLSFSFLFLCSHLHSFFFRNFPLLQLQIGGLCQPRYPVTSGHMPMHRHLPA